MSFNKTISLYNKSFKSLTIISSFWKGKFILETPENSRTAKTLSKITNKNYQFKKKKKILYKEYHGCQRFFFSSLIPGGASTARREATRERERERKKYTLGMSYFFTDWKSVVKEISFERCHDPKVKNVLQFCNKLMKLSYSQTPLLQILRGP